MPGTRMVTLGHQELVCGVQRAVTGQLRRDGRLEAGMELGLVFCLHTPEEISVVCTVRRDGQLVYELNGDQAQLCAVAAQLALDKLEPQVRKGLEPVAEVRWRSVRTTVNDPRTEQFFANVTFHEQRYPQGGKGVLH